MYNANWQPLCSPNMSGGRERRKDPNRLARNFLVDVLGISTDVLPDLLPDPEATHEQIRAALDYAEWHARRTLYPTEQDNAPRYRTAVDAALRRIGALRHIYVNSGLMKDLATVDGEQLSATGQQMLIKSARAEARAFIMGNPNPGWMDGRPIDELRATIIGLLPDELTMHESHALDVRRNMLDYDYDIRAVPIDMLPISHETKRRCKLAGYHVLGLDVLRDPTQIRGIGPDSDLPLVVGRLTEYDPSIDSYSLNRAWIGEES